MWHILTLKRKRHFISFVEYHIYWIRRVMWCGVVWNGSFAIIFPFRLQLVFKMLCDWYTLMESMFTSPPPIACVNMHLCVSVCVYCIYYIRMLTEANQTWRNDKKTNQQCVHCMWLELKTCTVPNGWKIWMWSFYRYPLLIWRVYTNMSMLRVDVFVLETRSKTKQNKRKKKKE